MGWSGLFEPGRSAGVYGGSKVAVETQRRGLRDSNICATTCIEIDVLNLSAAGEPTIFRSLAFMGTTLNSDDQHRDFFSESTSSRLSANTAAGFQITG